MLGNKIELDPASTQVLKTMKARTGLTHQYLCRLAFGLSLAESTPPDPNAYVTKGGLDFNRYTLTGEMDRLFVAYLREWLLLEGLADEDEGRWLRAHINRGLTLLQRRVRRLADIAELVPASA